MPKHSTVDDYIAALPASAQTFATQLRQTILSVAPNATETIRYDMPAYSIGTSTFIYFACWKNHIGLYPIYRGDDAFEAELKPYRTKKDTVQFLYSNPLPKPLIVKILRSQIANLQR